MDSSFHLIHTGWKQSHDALSSVRRSVFIDEQQVPEELEWDEFDESSHHILITDAANRPLATGRIKPDGHIGRMAVLPEYRQQGVGSAMLAALLDYARHQKLPQVYLHAQVSAIAFYEKHGFTVSSDLFMDAGIPHKTMTRNLD